MEALKTGFGLLGRYFVCLIMCFFIVSSFTMIFSMTTMKVVGYDAYVVDTENNNEIIAEYRHYSDDGDDAKKSEYEAEGYTVETKTAYSDFAGTPYIACQTISQIICLVFFVAMVPWKLYKIGGSDSNRVSCGRIKKDMLFGLKAGMVPAAVSFITWVALLIGKITSAPMILQLYAFANYHLYGYQKLIFGQPSSAAQIGWGGIILALVPTVITLLLSAVVYVMGYKGIYIVEKTIYKK